MSLPTMDPKIHSGLDPEIRIGPSYISSNAFTNTILVIN